MDEKLKQRLVGAIVLFSLAIIFVPMLLEDGGPGGGLREPVVPPPPGREAFTSHVLPDPGESMQAPAPRPVERPPVESVVVAVPDNAPPLTSPPPPSKQGARDKQVRIGLSSWVIQVGSFSTQEAADQLIRKLRAKQFTAFLEQASVRGKDVFRVRVGPELDRKRADQTLARMRKEMDIKGLVVQYP